MPLRPRPAPTLDSADTGSSRQPRKAGWTRIELATTVSMVAVFFLLLAITFSAFQNSSRLQDAVGNSDIAAGNEGDIAPMAGHLSFALERWADGQQDSDVIDVNRGGLIRQLNTAAASAPTEAVRQRYSELLSQARQLSADIEEQQKRSPDPERGPADPGHIRSLAATADNIVRDAQHNRQHSNRIVFAQTQESQRRDRHYRHLTVVTGGVALALGVATIGLFRRRLRLNHDAAIQDLDREDRRRQEVVELLNQQTSILAHQATHDALTGLLNRAALVDVLERALDETDLDHEWVAFLFCDLDRFKFVNDTFGHDAGDELLRHVSSRLRAQIGENGKVGRMGGDEFGIALSGNATDERPADIARRIVADVGRVYEIAGRWVDIDVCVGVAVAPGSAILADELLRRADIALYAAKDQGRSQVAEFDLDLAAAAYHRRGVEQALHSALTAGSLEVHYQPIVPIHGGAPSDMEALVRWRHDDELLEPVAFLAIAESAGLIARVDEFVLAQACRDGAGLMRDGVPVGMCVNVSSATLGRADFVDLVTASVRDAGFAYDRLCVEVTEATLLHDAADTRRKLETIRGYGARIAVDDFGTGYSAMQYLVELPLDFLKIDRHFVSQLNTVTGDAIVEMTINLARALGLRTVAEGVETAQQREQLAALGCDAIQGYSTGRAQPIGELRASLA